MIVLLVIVGLIILFLLIGNITNREKPVEVIAGSDAGPSDALIAAWKSTPSDITGMTKWDKYEAGLSVANGSDSDGDGLTDKEEIETHHSDPLSVSTAGDLYTDLYKVQNGMDLTQKYVYNTALQEFPYNSCPEVILSAQTPNDFNAVVTALPTPDSLNGQKVYAAYNIYNYSGKFTVNLASILQKEALKLSNISVYVSDGNSVEYYPFTKKAQTITLKTAFSPTGTYTVFITQKNFLRFAASRISADDALAAISSAPEASPQQVTGAGLVIVSPILAEFANSPISIYYEKQDNDIDRQTLRNALLNHVMDYFHISSRDKYRFAFHEVSAIQIDLMYNTLRSAVSFLDVTDRTQSSLNLEYIFFLYYSYEDKLAFERKSTQEISTPPATEPDASTPPEDVFLPDPNSGFHLKNDTLPFGNFSTDRSPNGSCAGISHLTAYLYNQKRYPVHSDNGFIPWDLESDPENATLCEPGLGDYKDENFVQIHSTDGQTLNTDLTSGEEAFKNMITDAYLTGNQNAEFILFDLWGGNHVVQDYSVIESAIAYLESGKILDVYLDMVDGTRHAVNIYGYRKETENVIWFSVYDSNFPCNRADGTILSDAGFALRVEKKLKTSGDGHTFSFDYFPLENRSYGASSNPSLSGNNLILILDEFGHLLND